MLVGQGYVVRSIPNEQACVILLTSCRSAYRSVMHLGSMASMVKNSIGPCPVHLTAALSPAAESENVVMASWEGVESHSHSSNIIYHFFGC